MFYIVHGWVLQHVKNLFPFLSVSFELLHVFITGNAGCCKPFLATVYQSLTKGFSYKNSELENPKHLLLAPREVTLISIGGKAMYVAPLIPVGYFVCNDINCFF